DVEKDTELKQKSIERAQQTLESQRHELEQTLGRLDGLHKTGPAMPKLNRVAPRVSAQDFVLRAKRAQGAQVDPLSDGLYAAQWPGKPKELLAFDEAAAQVNGASGVFMGNVPKLYVSGKPAFERLTQYWADYAGHRLVDFCPKGAGYAEALA